MEEREARGLGEEGGATNWPCRGPLQSTLEDLLPGGSSRVKRLQEGLDTESILDVNKVNCRLKKLLMSSSPRASRGRWLWWLCCMYEQLFVLVAFKFL